MGEPTKRRAGGESAGLRPKGLVSVVIPAYNEAGVVAACLHETVAVLEELGGEYEVVLVDDGSHDETLTLARRTADELARVRVLGTGVNLGKGSALARGVYASVGDYVLFLDADLEIHPRQIRLLLEQREREDADVVIGSKLHTDSIVEYPFRRRVLSFGYYALVRTLFRLPVRDTQTGLKLYKRSVLLRVVPRLLVKRFAHDLEALVNVHRLGYKIVEAPVVVTRQRAYDRIGLRDALHVA